MNDLTATAPTQQKRWRTSMKTFHRIKVNRWPWCVRVPRWFAMRVWLWLPGDWHSQSSGAVGGSLITRSLSGNQEFHALPDHADGSAT